MIRPLRTACLAAGLAFGATALAAQDLPHPVKLVMVNEGPDGLSRQFFGQVAARQTVDLAFQVGGQIVEFPVVEGAPVAEGDLIARLDLENFELAAKQARLQLDQAQRAVARLERLSGSAVSQSSMDDATTQAALAEISVNEAENALEDATLLAPFDGIVASRNVANFTTISPGTPVVRLHDMSELRVDIDVPELLFQLVGIQRPLEFEARFPGNPNTYPLELREFDAEASAIGQSYQITLGMTPPEGLRVYPGSSVTVVAFAPGMTQPPAIPASAVAIAPDGAMSVMAFRPDGPDEGTVQRTPVTLEASDNGVFRVLDGVSPGTEIVAAGAAQLKDGQRVRRFKGFED